MASDVTWTCPECEMLWTHDGRVWNGIGMTQPGTDGEGSPVRFTRDQLILCANCNTPRSEWVTDQWDCGACGKHHVYLSSSDGEDGSASEWGRILDDGSFFGIGLDLKVRSARCSCGAPRPSQPGILEAEKAKDDNAPREASNDESANDVSIADEVSEPERQLQHSAVRVGHRSRTRRALAEAAEHVYCRQNPIPEGGHPCKCAEGTCFAAAMGARKPPIKKSNHVRPMDHKLSEIHRSLTEARHALDRATLDTMREQVEKAHTCLSDILYVLDEDGKL